jgi:hypothetical protein
VQFAGGAANANSNNATSGSIFFVNQTANNTNGNANSGAFSFTGANAISVNGNANSGQLSVTLGTANASNGSATGGSITFKTGSAISNSGAATSGNINLQVGLPNGVSNTIGQINIGSQAANTTITAPAAINIGQANTPTIIGGNANVSGNLNVTSNANVTGTANVTGNTTLGNLNVSNITSNVTMSLGGSNVGTVTFTNMNPTLNLDNIDTGFGSYKINQYNNSNSFGYNYNWYRSRGTLASPSAVIQGDEIMTQDFSVYLDSGNTNYNAAGFSVAIGNTTTREVTALFASQTPTISNFKIRYNVEVDGNFRVGNIGNSNTTLYANGYISTNNEIDYLRTFGSFTSNVTQTNSNVGNAILMTLNNTEYGNGVSIVSNSQITIARTGYYNLQFSAQIEKTDIGTDEVEIWLKKNGNNVANSATRLAMQGNNEKGVAAWNWVIDADTANTYYQIAWASTDANMQIVAIPSANTLSGVAVPSLIVTVVPVGA